MSSGIPLCTVRTTPRPRLFLEAMKTRYVLRFEPDRGRREGLHELEVGLTRRKGKVHGRKAYFVGPPSR